MKSFKEYINYREQDQAAMPTPPQAPQQAPAAAQPQAPQQPQQQQPANTTQPAK